MNTQVSNSNLFTNANITNSWNGGYKLVVDITSDATAEDWELNFDLPYTIRGAFGGVCLLYTSPSPRDLSTSRMPSSA